MTSSVTALIKKGAVDTLLQILATTGVRLGLVLTIFMLAPFVSNNEIATYDLFVVASSLLLIFFTIGLDSGLVIVTRIKDPDEQYGYLWIAVMLSLGLGALLYFPLKFGTGILGLSGIFDARIFTIAYFYALANAMMTLLFAFYRWLGQALVASLTIIVANVIGFTFAISLFVFQGTIEAFLQGLLLGNVGGAIASLLYVYSQSASFKELRSRLNLVPMTRTLVSMSWPFGIASAALIARRTIDRGLIVTVGLSSVLGAYALVSRSGEVAAFLFSLPAAGFVPIIVRDHQAEANRQLARLLYGGYMLLALITLVCGALAWEYWGASLFPDNARSAAPVFLALLASNLFFSETSIAGFGFVIVQRTFAVALYSVLFMTINASVAIGLVWGGYGLEAIAAGFLIASYVFSTLFIARSEKHVEFGYPLLPIALIKGAATLAILAMMFKTSL